jgi:hypothetical protein
MTCRRRAYDACEKKAGRVSSLSLVRYRGADYSVPTTYGHREILIRGYVDEMAISCGAVVIARHRRSYEREDFVFDPLHYLALMRASMSPPARYSKSHHRAPRRSCSPKHE